MYQTQIVQTSKLQPNDWNSNVVSPDNEAKLDASLSRFGLYKPIVVRELGVDSYQILGGQHRWESAKRLSIMEVPIVNLGVIPDHQAKEISLVDNGRYGVDDATQLAAILRDLGDVGDLSAFLPYSSRELDSIFQTADLDLDSLEVRDDKDAEVDLSPDVPEMQTHQIMRFKVPSEDAEAITELIEKTMKAHNYTEGDQLQNAGDALVHLLLTKDETDE